MELQLQCYPQCTVSPPTASERQKTIKMYKENANLSSNDKTDCLRTFFRQMHNELKHFARSGKHVAIKTYANHVQENGLLHTHTARTHMHTLLSKFSHEETDLFRSIW